ncbi:phosphotransferase [Lysinibacillus pakistanensis]|uniref:phosphotransferase enzyme family protein n=1 Tax=Lysinibacillus pakistanensis TaxID=759811 RepID=UPI003D2AC424
MGQMDFLDLEAVLSNFHQAAHDALKEFSCLAGASCKMIDYSENSTYLVEDGQGKKYILRISRPNYHKKEEIEAEIAWLNSLHEQSPIDVSLPIRADDGDYVHAHKLNDIIYYSTLFTFLEGNAPDENNEEDLIQQFETLGTITAMFHKHTIEQHEYYKDFKRMTWDYDTIVGNSPKWARWQDGLGMTPSRLALYEEASLIIKKKLEAFGKSKTRFGLIHSDLRLANLLIFGDEIKVIDFDDCGFGWFLYDLATSVSFIEHMPYLDDLIASWLKGYSKIRTLTDEEIEMIPTFILMRRLQLISWIGSRDNETTRLLGENYTVQSDALVNAYLEKSRVL